MAWHCFSRLPQQRNSILMTEQCIVYLTAYNLPSHQNKKMSTFFSCSFKKQGFVELTKEGAAVYWQAPAEVRSSLLSHSYAPFVCFVSFFWRWNARLFFCLQFSLTLDFSSPLPFLGWWGNRRNSTYAADIGQEGRCHFYWHWYGSSRTERECYFSPTA